MLIPHLRNPCKLALGLVHSGNIVHKSQTNTVHVDSCMAHNWFKSNLLLFVEMNCYQQWIDDNRCTASPAGNFASSAEMAFGKRLDSLAMHLQAKQSKTKCENKLLACPLLRSSRVNELQENRRSESWDYCHASSLLCP